MASIPGAASRCIARAARHSGSAHGRRWRHERSVDESYCCGSYHIEVGMMKSVNELLKIFMRRTALETSLNRPPRSSGLLEHEVRALGRRKPVLHELTRRPC